MPSDSEGENQGGVPRPQRSRHGTLVVEPEPTPPPIQQAGEKLTPAPMRAITAAPPPAPHASRYRTHVGLGIPEADPPPQFDAAGAAVPPAPRPAAGAPPPPSARGVLQPLPSVQVGGAPASRRSQPPPLRPSQAPPAVPNAPGMQRFTAEDDEATVVMERAVYEAGRYRLTPGDDGRLYPSSRPPPPAGQQPTPTIPDNPKPAPPSRKRSYTPTQVGLPRFEEDEPAPRKAQPSVADLLEDELAAHGLAGQAVLAPEAQMAVAPTVQTTPSGREKLADGFGQHKAYDPTRAYPELPSAAPYEPAPASSQVARPQVRANKWLYRGLVFGGLLLATGLSLVAALKPALALLSVGAGVLLLAGWAGQLVLLYKAWLSIQDGNARTSPFKAVALLFVPLFNLYWIFNVLPGFATDFNRYIQRHRVDAEPLSQNLILAAMVVPGFGVFLWWIVIGRLCDSINALSRR